MTFTRLPFFLCLVACRTQRLLSRTESLPFFNSREQIHNNQTATRRPFTTFPVPFGVTCINGALFHCNTSALRNNRETTISCVAHIKIKGAKRLRNMFYLGSANGTIQLQWIIVCLIARGLSVLINGKNWASCWSVSLMESVGACLHIRRFTIVIGFCWWWWCWKLMALNECSGSSFANSARISRWKWSHLGTELHNSRAWQ